MTAHAVSGYGHTLYAQSHHFLGETVALPRSGGNLVLRSIPGTYHRDAIGCYPLFTCANWNGLAEDLAELPEDIIAISLVTDPLADITPAILQRSFDFARPYKQHHLAELAVPFASYLHRHHRRYARRALAAVTVERADDRALCKGEWPALYSEFCAKRGIRGIAAFTAEALAAQLAVPGCEYFRAVHGGETVGGLVCYSDGGNVYAHLIATSQAGHALQAQYALYWGAIEYFRSRAQWFNLGAVPDGEEEGNGLALFKKGWATDMRLSFFCGKILRPENYCAVCAAATVRRTDFFPAYRADFADEGPVKLK